MRGEASMKELGVSKKLEFSEGRRASAGEGMEAFSQRAPVSMRAWGAVRLRLGPCPWAAQSPEE